MGWKSDYELRKEQKKANKAITKNSNYFVNKKNKWRIFGYAFRFQNF